MRRIRLAKTPSLLFFLCLLLSVSGWLQYFYVLNWYDIIPKVPSTSDRPSIAPFSNRVVSIHQLRKKKGENLICFDEYSGRLSISTLENAVHVWRSSFIPICKSSYNVFSCIYSISTHSGKLQIPLSYQKKVKQWLGNNQQLFNEVYQQQVTFVFNKYTHEESMMNPLRSKRPGVKSDINIREYVYQLAKNSKADCDFCNSKELTAEDVFGHIESEYAITASNTFKYDAYHSLIILKTHNPIDFDEIQFVDMMETAYKWYRQVNLLDGRFAYPHLNWDCLPKASASQVHPHAQASLAPHRYYGLMEHLRLSGMKYSIENHNRNYFSDLLMVHATLGLTTFLGNATAMAYLTPKKDYEVMILSQSACRDFYRLIFYTVRALIDDLELFAWSMALVLPKMGELNADEAEMPALARIISRGPATSTRSDVSGLELFDASNVDVDPFRVIGYVENSLKKYFLI